MDKEFTRGVLQLIEPITSSLDILAEICGLGRVSVLENEHE